VIESLNRNLWINVETALTRNNQPFAVLSRVIVCLGRGCYSLLGRNMRVQFEVRKSGI
jgi:hypothetical protein